MKHNKGDHHQMMLADFKKRFFVSLLLMVPILVLSPMVQTMVGLVFHFFGDTYLLWLLATMLFFYGGKPFLVGLYNELKNRRPGMMTLIGVAIAVAYVYSTAVVFFIPGPVFFWELATLIVVMLLGHWIEMRSVMGASSALEKLAELMPANAHLVLPDGTIKDVPSAEIKKGDKVLVRPGQKVSADGVVLEGESEVNEAALTGESKLIFKQAGMQVIAGSLNETGSLTIEVQKDQKDNYIAQVIKLVQKVMASKSQAQNIADKAALALTIVALSAGLVTFVAWLYFGGIVSFALERMVSVMVITCPHALGLAIPLVIVAITTLAARQGFLIRNRTAFEQAKDVDLVVFDKTGTLTEGRFQVSDLVPFGDTTEEKLLEIAASIEQQATHSIARAIVKKAIEKNISLASVTQFKTIAGKGVTAQVDDTTWYVGTQLLLEDMQLQPSNLQEALHKLKELQKEAKTPILVANGQRVIGIIAAADVVRDVSREAIDRLHARGIKTAMITGDNAQTAEVVAGLLSIDTVLAQVLPHEKAAEIESLQRKGYTVAMVGDGINDAPALVVADVGIAIGAGTDVAIESADIILVQNDPRQVVDVIDLSKLTYRKMIQNLFWAAGYNIVALPLAAGVFYNYGIMIDPAFGALLMSLSTVIVAINAQLIYLRK